jgi:hypothetical protein
MMKRHKPATVLLASLVLAPVLVAGRPACCTPAPAVKIVSLSCCAAMSGATASSPKGCCKVPTAPKPETRVKDQAPLAAAIPTLTLGAPESASLTVPAAVAARLARHAHHADAPDDSPPDLLSQIHVLLI